MEITPMSMEAVIMQHADDLQADPHLKKLFAELQALKDEIGGTKGRAKSSSGYKNTVAETKETKVRAKRRNTTGDALFRCSAYVAPIRRKSDRLSGKPCTLNYIDDIDEIENNVLYANGELKNDYTVKIRKSFHKRHVNTIERIILTPEEITQDMLNNICYKLNDRVYDKEYGTSCHQCRQKTIDTKTICRNLDCIGVRGQFCGPCAQNRYGVDVAKALLDPHWSCFVCQGICNCSFCRSRNGKRPTGILTPIARRSGHDNVKEFLDELKLSLQDENDFNAQMEDSESVLGFSDDINLLTVNGTEQILYGCLSGFRADLIREIINDFDSYFHGFTVDDIDMSKEKVGIIKNLFKLANPEVFVPETDEVKDEYSE